MRPRHDDLPLALQVFWKLLTAAMTGMMVYVALTESLWFLIMAGIFALVCLFTELGE